MQDHELLNILVTAINSARGVELEVNDGKLFQQRFHRYRNKARQQGDVTYDDLNCRVITDTKIYLIKKGDNDDSGLGESDSQTEQR